MLSILIYCCNKYTNANMCENECERSAAEINWGLGGTLREVCMYVCVHTYMLGPTRPEYKRWIAMETDCKPVGKESNYDMLGNQVRAV